MQFDLRQVRHAVALAEHGSFARAAQAVHLSQPALSRSIQALEQRSGALLFDRGSAGVVPTDVGRVFLQRARDLLAMAEELDREVLRNRTLQGGRVVAGAGPFPADTLVGDAAGAYASEFPLVTIEVRVQHWDELLRDLRARELDFFVAEISTLEHEQDLQIQALRPHPLVFAAGAGHPLVRRRRLVIDDTFAYPFVAPSRIPPRVLEPLLAAQRRARAGGAVARAFPAIQCPALSSVKRIVETSDAITALTPAGMRHELADGRLAMLLAPTWLHLRYGIVRLRQRTLTRAAEAFVQHLAAADERTAAEDQALMAAAFKSAPRVVNPAGGGPRTAVSSRAGRPGPPPSARRPSRR